MLRLAILAILLGLALPGAPAHADKRSDLFEALRSQTTEAGARAAEDAIWRMWMSQGPSDATVLVEQAMKKRETYDFAGALELLNRAVELAPDWAEAWNQRGFIHFLRENYDEALSDVDRAIELEPMHFAALAGKAHILMRQGRMELGQQALRKAVEIDPFLRERSMLIPLPGREL